MLHSTRDDCFKLLTAIISTLETETKIDHDEAFKSLDLEN